MENTKTLEILKQAILLERRGKAFYASVAKQAHDEDVKNFFELMAKEEDEHIKFLSEQFGNYNKTKQFDATNLPKTEENNTAEEILSDKVKERITASSFEAAAIQSAIDMENRAVKVYSERAESAEDPEERKFYQWLADWEKGHNRLLIKIDNELKEEVWHDNNFWPF